METCTSSLPIVTVGHATEIGEVQLGREPSTKNLAGCAGRIQRAPDDRVEKFSGLSVLLDEDGELGTQAGCGQRQDLVREVAPAPLGELARRGQLGPMPGQ